MEKNIHCVSQSSNGQPRTSAQNVDVELASSETPAGPTIEPPYSIFSHTTKHFIVWSVSVSALISPFGSSTLYPALNVLAQQLHVTPTMINLSVTTYMIAQGIAPSIIAGMSDNGGRRLSFIMCFVIYIAANIGLALQTNYAALLVLRVVQAAGCSASVALSMAVVADIATSAERGKYIGYATTGLVFGPAFGPTIGGLLAQYLGWRAIFWFLAIFTGGLLLIFSVFFPETCRNVVGNGSIPAKGVNRSVLGYLQQRRNTNREVRNEASHQTNSKKRKISLPNPLSTLRLLGEKETSIILLYNGLFFTGMMMIFASIPKLFEDAYGLDELQIGLCYIAMGAGSLLASVTMGHIVDWNFRRHAKKLGMTITKGKQPDLASFPIELVRFQVVVPGHVIGTFAYIVYGWTVKYRVHIAGPEVAQFFIGFGVSSAFNITNTLLIDIHREGPAAATAAVNLVRCLMSAGGVAAIVPITQAMNPGWAFTAIGLVNFALLAVVFLLMNKGLEWRTAAAKYNAEKMARLVEQPR